MFEQEERGASRREGGLGIGLGLARELVTLHGGEIDAASPGAGLGATFTLRLPLHERSDFVPLDATVELANPLQACASWSSTTTPTAIETFGMLLEHRRRQVTAARSGAEALHLCETTGFDLIISDIGMPMMDGSRADRQPAPTAGRRSGCRRSP